MDVINATVNATINATEIEEELIFGIPSLAFTYAAMLLMAIFPIIIGSNLAANRAKHEDTKAEAMSMTEAYMFPIYASAALLGLFLLFKYFRPELINLLFSIYFFVLGVLISTSTLSSAFTFIRTENKPYEIKFGPIWKLIDRVELSFGIQDILAFIIGCFFSAWYITSKNWIANNVLGLAFAVEGVALLNPGSWKVGSALLSLLFFL